MVGRAAEEEERKPGMSVLFASAELAPLVSVGGLAEASAGLVHALRAADVDVEVVVPDYFGTPLAGEAIEGLEVPHWVGGATARRGVVDGVGDVTLVDAPGLRRPNPYVDDTGRGWPDNADRFMAFSAAVAALVRTRRPELLHLNDWHTAAALGFLEDAPPTVLTIHTLGHQGWTSGGWLDRFVSGADAYEAYGGTNPLAGGIQLADRVIAVSPNYAAEITTPEGGAGLHAQLAALGSRLVGIRNGIDVSVWDPRTDGHIAAQYSSTDLTGKDRCREVLLAEIGWEADGRPVIGIVTRLVEQKGIELALEAIRFAAGVPFRVALLGSGERWIADWAHHVAREQPDALWFTEGYDAALAHRIFAGADALLMPSRFEPCGLAQMQAMQYGTIPIVTPVGGLIDTVTDADASRMAGTGFVAKSTDTAGVVDAVHRAVRAWKQPRRRAAIQRRGMETDWSWIEPARRHIELYAELAEGISRS